MADCRHYKLICVTDRLSCPGYVNGKGEENEEAFLQRVGEIARSRADAVILRERDLSPEEYSSLAGKALQICRQYGMPCILHKYIPEAKALGAEYVHVSVPKLKETSPDMLQQFKGFGVSCHSTEDALYAQSRGAAYILAGHVYDTACKLGTPGKGPEYLKGMCASVHIPVYAIGGISPERVPQALSCGAAGVCSMSGFMTAPNVQEYARNMSPMAFMPPVASMPPVVSMPPMPPMASMPPVASMFSLRREDLKLYVLTDPVLRPVQEECERVRRAILGGATMIQLRKKQVPEELHERYAAAISRICREHGVPCIINDDVPLALKYADGVHLGQEDASVQEVRSKAPRGFIIGCTAKTPQQAKAAEAAGADYLGSGAMFPSSTKSSAQHISPEQLDEICASVSIPVAAIGGISAANILSLKGTKAAGAAVSAAVYGAEDISKAAREMRSLAEEAFI